MSDFESVTIRQTARLAFIAETLETLGDELMGNVDPDRVQAIGERLVVLAELAEHPDRA